ncbi:MAG: hypothetical protein ACREOG_06220, partial [Gemmatimonadaceae bacterium]
MHTRAAILCFCCGLLAACRPATRAGAPAPLRGALPARVVPQPVSLTDTNGEAFVLSDSTTIVVDVGNADVARTAEQLAALVRPSTG